MPYLKTREGSISKFVYPLFLCLMIVMSAMSPCALHMAHAAEQESVKPEDPIEPSQAPPPENETNIYVLYDAQGGLLDVFNVSSTEKGMDIIFSNSSVTTETIDLLIYANIEAIQYITGFNASIADGAKIMNGSVDLCNSNFSFIENYQTFDLGDGAVAYAIHFEPALLIERVKNVSASFIRFELRVGGWKGDTSYILHIQPFLKEILYYEKDGNVYVDPSTLNLSPELRVSWQHYDDTRSYNWTYQDISWEFGPIAHYEISCYNDSISAWYEVTRDTWIELNSDVRMNVTIPKLLFEKGTELGRVELRWNMWATNISAYLTIYFDRSSDQWNSYSSILQKGETAEFFTLDRSRTLLTETFNESENYYKIMVTGQFNDLTPKGIYYVDLGIYDNRSNYIRGSTYYWDDQTNTHKKIAVGGAWSEVAAYFDKMAGGTYTVSIMNTDHEPVHSVGFNESFIIRFNVTGMSDGELANVSITFPLPWGMKRFRNVTGWHEEYRVYHGGWVYDTALENYVWDSNASIITKEWVYGSYLEEKWEDWSNYRKEINATRWEWNASDGQFHHFTYTEYVQPKIIMLYDNLNGSFGFYLFYEYYNTSLSEYDEGKQSPISRRYIQIEEVPPELTFYHLSNTAKNVGEDEISVEFEGKFVTKLATDLYLEYHVFSLQQEVWPRDWQWIEMNARYLSIEKAVINVRILGEKGEVFGDYVTDPGDWFLVEAKTEGKSDLKTDIDGVRITFRYNNYRWSPNETICSNLEIVTTVDLREDTYTSTVYNATSKSVYEYGPYQMWNATTGRTEEVETWHWDYYMLNQTSSEWVKGGIPWHAGDTVVNETYLTMNGFEAFAADDGRYVIQANMSFTEQANNRWYQFDVMPLNWTYGPDYSKPWGQYLSEDWVYSTVYTLGDGSVEVYVPKPELESYVEDLEGKKYLISGKPYIEINGEKLLLKEMKYWNGYQYEYRLLQEEWDYASGQQKHYYILENDTRIYVFEAYKAPVYNVTLSNGGNLLTCMEYPGWSRLTNKAYLVTLNGELAWLEEGTYWSSSSLISKVPIEFGGYFVLINGTRWENVTKGYFEWDWMTGQNFFEFTNGTRVYTQYDASVMYSWYFEKDSVRYYLDYPSEYYSGNYSGSAIVVPGWCRRTWYYTLVNGETAEVPYEGASSEYVWLSWWNLGRVRDEGGYVPVDDYAILIGSLHLVNYYEGIENQGWIAIDGGVVNVTKGTCLYTSIGGNDAWNVTQVGFKMFLANLTDLVTYDTEHLTELDVASSVYSAPDNITLILLNGTSLTAQSRIRAIFHQLELNGTLYYVANKRPLYNYTTGTFIFYVLNGSEIEIPASEEYEITKTIANDIGIYHGSIPRNFTWEGGTYNTTLRADSMGQIDLYYIYYCVDVDSYRYDIVPISVLKRTFGSSDLMVPRYADSDPYTYMMNFPMYNVDLGNGTACTLAPRLDYIKVARPSWGWPYGGHLQEFPWESMTIRKQSYNIIVGAPEWGLWGYRKFKTVPETGALDLDGNLDTTDDQFYVKRLYVGDYGYRERAEGLNVYAVYDPNPVIPEDELAFNAWTGITRNTYTNTWNETYFWYYPNMTIVSPEDMSRINETLWSSDGKTAQPGYWDLSRMALNMTWEDYLKKAEKEGWNWVSEKATWTWLWFGFEQSYWASNEADNGTFQSYHVRLRDEYAGMFIYNDTNDDSMMGEEEATHYFMPNAVGNVSFLTPGAPFGDYNATGTLVLPANESVEFGVSYLGVNGTMFPFGRSYYAWYGEDISGTDLRTFAERPVDAGVDELSFKVHLYAENSTTTNSTARVKTDQHVGDWTLDIPSNIAVLQNLSLSLNYYVYAELGGSWSVKTEEGSSIDPNDIVEASSISLDASGLKFAEVNMGDTYLWGGNLTLPYNVSSYTVPLQTFVNTYTSYGSDTSIGGWTFQNTMHFLSIGFPTWDGRYVYEDPEVVVYLGNSKRIIISPLTGWNPQAMQPAGGEQSEEPGPSDGMGTEGAWLFGSSTIDTTPPVADAGPDQTVDEDSLVIFDGSSSRDENSIASYTWTFTYIAPKTLKGANPTYNFTSPGKYIVTLNVTDPAGNYATDILVITIVDITPPIAKAGSDQTVAVNHTVSFDANGSRDNVGIVSYEWDFGDGNKDTGVKAAHLYKKVGTYTVTLTVRDEAGNEDTDTVMIAVKEAETVVDETTRPISVSTNSTVSNIVFDSAALRFNIVVSGPDGTTGVANVTILKESVPEGYGFQVFIDGEPLSFTLSENSTCYFIHLTYTHTQHQITIKLTDITPPSLSITSPGVDFIMSSSKVSVSWNASDAGSGIDHYELRLDEGLWASLGNDTSYTFSGLNDGKHTVYIRAVDKGSNSKEIKHDLIIDTTTPIVSIASPANGSEVRSSNVIVIWSGYDETSGTDHSEVRVDGGSWINVGTDSTYTFTGLADGEHEVNTRVLDKAGLSKESTAKFIVNTSLIGGPGWTDDTMIFAIVLGVAVSAAIAIFLSRRH